MPAGRGIKVEATCIIAREIDAPADVEPIEWRLLTNRSATTSEEVIELIDWYRARWDIEIFFHILKNACKVEAMQLSHIDNIERALALFMVVAWRIAYLMRLGRTCPDIDASHFFDPDEIRGAYLLTKERRPDRPPDFERSLAPDRPRWRIPWTKGRRRSWRENHLAGDSGSARGRVDNQGATRRG